MVLESKPECFVTFGISRIMARSAGEGPVVRFAFLATLIVYQAHRLPSGASSEM